MTPGTILVFLFTMVSGFLILSIVTIEISGKSTDFSWFKLFAVAIAITIVLFLAILYLDDFIISLDVGSSL